MLATGSSLELPCLCLCRPSCSSEAGHSAMHLVICNLQIEVVFFLTSILSFFWAKVCTFIVTILFFRPIFCHFFERHFDLCCYVAGVVHCDWSVSKTPQKIRQNEWSHLASDIFFSFFVISFDFGFGMGQTYVHEIYNQACGRSTILRMHSKDEMPNAPLVSRALWGLSTLWRVVKKWCNGKSLGAFNYRAVLLSLECSAQNLHRLFCQSANVLIFDVFPFNFIFCFIRTNSLMRKNLRSSQWMHLWKGGLIVISMPTACSWTAISSCNFLLGSVRVSPHSFLPMISAPPSFNNLLHISSSRPITLTHSLTPIFFARLPSFVNLVLYTMTVLLEISHRNKASRLSWSMGPYVLIPKNDLCPSRCSCKIFER